ncbi:hypothetical protein J4410_02040 [Candidatus Woesearchaeota archaeon]|nr:hypothetical protein [Candidatus Woesearchaeota archaeon]
MDHHQIKHHSTPTYQPQTAKSKEPDSSSSFSLFQGNPLTKFLLIVIIVLSVMLFLSHTDQNDLKKENALLSTQNQGLQKLMHDKDTLITEKEKTITGLEKEKLDMLSILDDEKKSRNIAERETQLTKLSIEDAQLQVQSSDLETQQRQQELSLEKQKNEELNVLITSMKNNTEVLKQRVTDLNEQLNQCILSS